MHHYGDWLLGALRTWLIAELYFFPDWMPEKTKKKKGQGKFLWLKQKQHVKSTHLMAKEKIDQRSHNSLAYKDPSHIFLSISDYHNPSQRTVRKRNTKRLRYKTKQTSKFKWSTLLTSRGKARRENLKMPPIRQWMAKCTLLTLVMGKKFAEASSHSFSNMCNTFLLGNENSWTICLCFANGSVSFAISISNVRDVA